MADASATTRRLLLVEDNPGDAELVREHLAQGGEDYAIAHETTLDGALSQLLATEFDIVLLDLSLGADAGPETVSRVHEAQGDVPIVVLTGSNDPSAMRACMDAGAHDFLEKDSLTGRDLHRAVGYAVSRKRESELRATRMMLAHYRQLSSNSLTTSVTAILAGSGPLAERSPAAFEEAVAGYRLLVVPVLDQTDARARTRRDDMEAMATLLGDCNAGPRDLLDVHIAALESALSGVDDMRTRAVMFEARLLALQMMGLLVDYYRVGQRRGFAGGRTP